MTGYMLAIAPCLRCGTVFSFNPAKVPSQRLTPGGEKEPICRYCYERLNRLRVVMGEKPWPEPLPGAYEPGPESEV